MHQHVSFKDSLVSSHKAALWALVCFLVGMKMSYMLVKLHWIESGKRTEATPELCLPSMALSSVLLETALVGTREVTLCAVKGLMCAKMNLHIFFASEQCTACVVMTLYGLDTMRIQRVLLKQPLICRLKGATLVETWYKLSILCDMMGFHMTLQCLTLVKALLASGACVEFFGGICFSLMAMHAGDVAVQRVTFHGSILAQLTAMQLFTRLPQHVNTQLAFAGKVVLAGGTLQAGVGKMKTHVLHQVRACLKAASALCTYVSAKHVLCALMTYNTDGHHITCFNKDCITVFTIANKHNKQLHTFFTGK